MKIGVIGCFYECAERFEAVFSPWAEVRREQPGGHEFVLVGINMQFAEYKALGYPNNDEITRALLRTHAEDFDSLIIETEVSENEARVRTRGLEALRSHDVDLVWILDSDEYYTRGDIERIIGFIEKTPQYDYYHVHFDNLDFGNGHWEDAYFPPRIFRSHRHRGVREFLWDNDIVWADGTTPRDTVPGIIPRHIAHIPHPSWRTEDAEKKIAYHRTHFGYCPFSIDEATGEPVLDSSYFARQHGILPGLRGDGTVKLSKPSLHVILRTHSRGNYRETIRRAVDTESGKSEITLRSLSSLVQSLLVLERTNQVSLRLSIVDDHSDISIVDRVKHILDICPFPGALIHTDRPGNEASMMRAFSIAETVESDFVYFVEDDYLHEVSALSEMVESWRIFSQNLGARNIALFPVDYIDCYRPNMIETTRVVLGSGRHWRLVPRTTFTFFIPREHFLTHKTVFLRGPENGMNEKVSTNVVWEQHTYLFSPIPSLALHLHEEVDMPPFMPWRKLWNDAGRWLSTYESVA